MQGFKLTAFPTCHVHTIENTLAHSVAALVGKVDAKIWEGGLAGGLLRWNRPSLYQGRGGEKTMPCSFIIIQSFQHAMSMIANNLREPVHLNE